MALADRGMRRERLDLVLLTEPREDLIRLAERVLRLGEVLDEARAALEELRELLDRQLPR